MSAHGHSEGLAKELKIIIAIIGIALLYQFFPLSFDLNSSTEIKGSKVIKLGSGLDNLADKDGGYVVSRIVDGDTIEVSRNGETTKVRLLGINTPESVGDRAHECFGKEASAYATSIMKGETVKLETDDSQDKYDKYGRLLAYVYLLDNQMANRKLVAEGYAYEYTYDAPYKYQEDFKSLQSFAKREARGLWAKDTCNGVKSLVN
jgi:micrococcal nuclease